MANTITFAASQRQGRPVRRDGGDHHRKTRAPRAAQRGGALVIVLFLSISALALGLLSAVSARTEVRIAHNDVLDLQAFNVAEAGINIAVTQIGNHSNFNDELANNGSGACTGNGAGNASSGISNIGSAKTLTSDSKCYRFASFGGSLTDDGYYVRTEDNLDETSGGDVPTSDSDGTIRLIVHGKVGTAERIITGTLSLSGWGLFGVNGINLSGGSTVCSGNVVSCATGSSTARVGSNGTIALSGGSTVIKGTASAGTSVTLSGGASVTGTSTNNAASVTMPAVTNCGGPYSISGVAPAGTITMGSGGTYNSATGVLNQGGGHAMSLSPGTYCFSSVTLSGGSTMNITGATIIYMTGPWNTSGQSVTNSTGDPANLLIKSSYNCTGSTCFVLSGGSAAYMQVYAPQADIVLSGSSPFYGSFVGRSFDISGGSSVMSMGVTGAKLANWHEVQN
jgi:hypothetical protein